MREAATGLALEGHRAGPAQTAGSLCKRSETWGGRHAGVSGPGPGSQLQRPSGGVYQVEEIQSGAACLGHQGGDKEQSRCHAVGAWRDSKI